MAKRYAMESIFARFPFNNAEAKLRIEELKTPRVILTGETIPKYDIAVNPKTGIVNWVETTTTATPSESPVGVSVSPKEVTVESAKKIPKLNVGTPMTAGSEDVAGLENLYKSTNKTPTRISNAPKYTRPTAPNPNIYTRMAEVGTGGTLGKANVGLETALALYDIAREEGDTRQAYRSVGGGLSGLTLGGLKGLSRLGRAAGNALTLGTGEFLGVYDTIDLLQVESDALKLYERKYGKEKIPDPLKLSEIEANLAAERGIPASPMASDFYQGPEYRYKILNGKLTPLMTEEAASMFNEETARRNRMLAARPQIMNIDPSLGTLGYTPVRQFRPEVIGEYSMYDGR
jgi:hypothetical protein